MGIDDLKAMTKAELAEFAAENEIEISTSATKAVIVDEIAEALGLVNEEVEEKEEAKPVSDDKPVRKFVNKSLGIY